MAIASCVAKTFANKRGYSCGKWRTDYRKDSVILSHHGTEILKISADRSKIEKSTGYESKSDKGGVSRVLNELGIPRDNIKEIKGDRGFRFD